jgi:hypothetical protein
MSTLEARQLSVIFRQRGAAPLRAVDDGPWPISND